MSVWAWVLLVGVVWLGAGVLLGLALGRAVRPPWWERAAEDIGSLPERRACPHGYTDAGGACISLCAGRERTGE